MIVPDEGTSYRQIHTMLPVSRAFVHARFFRDFYAYVLLNVTLYRKLKRKGERMPEFILADHRSRRRHRPRLRRHPLPVNASTKRAAQEAESVVNDAKRQAETLRREAIIEAKDESSQAEAGCASREQGASARSAFR